MRAFVGVTDRDWFDFLRARPDLDEVNFWQPSARRPFSALAPGELFLFKLKSPINRIVAGGLFLWSGTFPFPYVWDLFEERNGAATLADLRDGLARLRRTPVETWDTEVGCIVLPSRSSSTRRTGSRAPPDWSPNIVRGKGYDLRSFYGHRLLEEVEAKAPSTAARGEIEARCSATPRWSAGGWDRGVPGGHGGLRAAVRGDRRAGAPGPPGEPHPPRSPREAATAWTSGCCSAPTFTRGSIAAT